MELRSESISSLLFVVFFAVLSGLVSWTESAQQPFRREPGQPHWHHSAFLDVRESVRSDVRRMLHSRAQDSSKGETRENEKEAETKLLGLLALTVGLGNQAEEILEESVTPLSQALKSGRDALKINSLLECLAVITFVGGTTPEQTENSMQIIWQMIHPKLGSNVVATKPSPAIITDVVSSWAFLLTTLDKWTLSPKIWREIVTYLSLLLEKDDRSVRIAAGEALAVIFELGDLEKFSAAA